ncbi:MAG: lipid-A-disaccharide synthase [Gemmatimonadetes bacterium]|uniref:Lipid-A-disaccharide synthase n=1 Tax=Candidatus Kutchimonas denitrificans TaxID=3056748 RepID=A0AAE4Z7M4_9BACT|nr:lipid-A-disaccharide synthase [Gemmatimonadota bacterium]NIR75279.1 lipid-A-disaccharide synthase [Candidatus Kutchimonas denitrificans]NIS00217.1 lipid-A-disaccharide synthase [Gemmatimonadota bacterium]NIT65809.1 lipid-A-disaccharide synthase [Gemmatimonadota bacterium]NIU53087.1 lipid-A-disaccharide synthase [Gemmatimonadota bacterium]
MSEPRILLAAGEASGDLHGASLAEELRRLYPRADLFGLAGPRMAGAGVEPIVDFEKLVVMGFFEIATRLPFFFRLRRRLRRILRERPPDLVIPIDYPGFNLRLSVEAHRAGIPVLYYIAPQLWAWRSERARTLADAVDRVAVAFPHEEPFLREFGVDAVFVGHPLLDRLDELESREEAISATGADPGRPILGLLPGSRPQEVRRLLGPFLQVARELTRQRPDVQVLLSGAPHVPRSLYDPARHYPLIEDSGTVLRAATAVLTKSGTTTVEAALYGVPLVIAHRVNPLTYRVARRLVRVKSVGMVNLLADEPVVPEFIQQLPVDRIAEALLPLLQAGSEARTGMVRELDRVRERLGDPGAARRVAELAAGLLDGNR